MDSLTSGPFNGAMHTATAHPSDSLRERTMTLLAPISLIAATITTGLTAGVFALYAHTIMPALRTTDDRTFVTAFTALDRTIINPWFMAGGFVGALLLMALAVVANLHRLSLPWVAAALALYLIAFVVTIAVHVPLNDAIKAAGDPARIHDFAAVRDRLHFARWVNWNYVRVATSIGAFACVTWALVLYGRATA
jgi:uncharacterized membrane protein